METLPASAGRVGGVFQNPSWLVVAALVVIRVVFGALVSVNSANFGEESDIARFRQIAATPGVPYRDFPVEYAPIETAIIEGIARGGGGSTLFKVAWLSLACDLAAFAAVAFGWGRRAGVTYLILGLPLLPFLYLRLDPVPVALTVWGLALVAREREGPGGALLAIGALTKLWPLVLVPALVVRGNRRALLWFALIVCSGLAAWFVVGAGLDGVRQVVTFRGAKGWEIESTVGVVVWMLTGGPLRWEGGTFRVGSLSWWSSLLGAALAAALAAVWLRARRWEGPVAGGAALAAVGALLALSPVFSLQYASWLLPWAAVASLDKRTSPLAWAAFAAVGLSGLLFVHRTLGYAGLPTWYQQVVLAIRDGLCLALPILWLRVSRTSRGVHRDTNDKPAGVSAGVEPLRADGSTAGPGLPLA